MDNERKEAILTWMNCLQVGRELTDFSALADGFHVTEILKIIWTSNEERNHLRLDNWVQSLNTFLGDFYRTRISDVVDFERMTKGDEFQIAKAAVLLLAATIHFKTDRRFLDLPTGLNPKIQHQIKEIIEGVFSDGDHPLNHNFADIFVSKDTCDCQIYETTSPRKSGDERSYPDGNDGCKLDSPIRKLLLSPLIVNQLKLRDKDRHIQRLEAELESERMLLGDAETELRKNLLLIDKKDKLLKRVERERLQFQEQYEETKLLFDKASVQLERFRSKCEHSDELLDECQQLRLELNSVINEKLALQDEVDRLEKAYRGSTHRLSELEPVEQNMCELRARLEDCESTIEDLMSERRTFLMDLGQMRQIYREKTTILEKALKDKPDSDGEIMTVVTEKCLKELQVVHRQLQDQYEAVSSASESTISRLSTEKTSLEAVIREKSNKILLLQEKRVRLQDELNKQNAQVSELAIKISKLEVDIEQVLAEKRELEEDVEMQHKTVADLRAERELKICEFRESEEQLLQLLAVKNSELAFYVDSCEMLKAEISCLDVELETLRRQLADDRSKWDLQVELITTEKKILEKELVAKEVNEKQLLFDLSVKEDLAVKLKDQVAVEKSVVEQIVNDREAAAKELEIQLEVLRMQLADNEEELQKCNDVITEMKRSHDEHLKECADNARNHREVISLKDDLIGQLEQQISDEKSSFEKIIDNRKSEMVNLMQRLEELQGKMLEERNVLLQTIEAEQSTALNLKKRLDCVERLARESDEKSVAVCKKAEETRLLLETTLKSREDEMESLKVAAEQKNGLVSEIREQLAREQEKSEKIAAEAKIAVGKLEREIEDRRRDFEKVVSDITEKSVAFTDLEKDFAMLEDNLETTQAEKLSLELRYNVLKEDIVKLESEIREKEEVHATGTRESELLRETLIGKQSTIDGLLGQMAELRSRVLEKDEQEAIYRKGEESLKAELDTFKTNVRQLEVEIDEKNEEIVELTTRLDAFQKITDEQQDMIKRLERGKMQLKDCSDNCERDAEGDQLHLQVPNLFDVEKARRKSTDVEFRLNYSDLRDVSLCPSLTVNGAFMEFKPFDVEVRPDDAMSNRMDCSQEFNMEDSLEDVKPAFVLSNESFTSFDDKCGRNQSASEAALLKNMQLHCDILQKENKTLFAERQSLESQVKELRDRLDKQQISLKLKTDLPLIVAKLKQQVFESETKNATALTTVKVEYEFMKKQCEVARKAAQEMKNGILEKEILLGEQARQLEKYKSYCDSKKGQLFEVTSLLKEEKEAVHFLKMRLHEEEKKCAPYIEKIREQEMSIQRHMQEKRSLETQLSLSSQKLRELQKGSLSELQLHTQAPIRASSHSALTRLTSSSLSVLTNASVPMRESVSHGQLAFEHLARTMSESTQDLDIKVWATANVSPAHHHRPVPVGVGNYFTCEDEEGEFHNFSYLNDLQRGRCNVEDHTGRISELQRRNTLCRPHLKTSYPIEMQIHATQKFTDDDLKAGAAVEDSLLPIKNETIDTSIATRKNKPIQPSYHKPGPPTPGRTGKQGSSSTVIPERQIKTPSSLKKLFKRSSYSFGTPKKGNRENVPPEKGKVSRVRQNIAFQIGFSPKVKSVSKQQQRRQPN